MIDHPDQVERLMERLNAVLPIPARVTPEVQMTLRNQKGTEIPASCSVTWISYAGDEGGIVCRLDAGIDAANEVFTSITHLRFDPRLPLAREIAAYQKHRVNGSAASHDNGGPESDRNVKQSPLRRRRYAYCGTW